MFEPFAMKPFGSYALVGAILLDLLLGDKDNPLHPVRMMGAAISWGEKRARAHLRNEFIAGLVMSTALIGLTFFVVTSVLSMVRGLSYWLFLLLSALLIYYGLCLRCLANEVLKVYEALCSSDLDLARRRLSMLVSRQTKDMDESEVARSAIETVSENLVDGVCSPFFYATLGGAGLCMTFKMVSTLDSMIGYKTERYRDFGRFAARLDDLANFLPARLSVPCVALAGLICKKRPFGQVVRGILQDARLSTSPNSGFPEAGFAYVLGVRLGGPVVYHGTLKDMPYINRQGRPPEPRDIFEAVRLLYGSAFIFYIVSLGLFLVASS
ncbi:MAG: cobalamin biosynthesis protein CobD [Thermodesulfobacteria bacterium]|nr:cobalamin biosynthesis protein CobD [Thermodesulfobacteriota bacterium]